MNDAKRDCGHGVTPMRRLVAGVLLALWSSVAPAQTYDNLDQAVSKLTRILVLTVKENEVKVEKGMYVRIPVKVISDSGAK